MADQHALIPEQDQPMPEILVGDARALPLADESVDLIVTSPPYFGLRDYGTPGQLGAEPTPAEFIAALIECTAEMMRVLKPSGSIFVNLGDKYSGVANGRNNNGFGGGIIAATHSTPQITDRAAAKGDRFKVGFGGVPYKSLCMLPERYRIAAVDELGLIARAVIVWSKPNGLPESVTDRVRRSHEDWVHLTKSPRYFSAVDEIREEHVRPPDSRSRDWETRKAAGEAMRRVEQRDNIQGVRPAPNPLGKLPGSVWSIPTQPLKVPAELGIDHFAAFPMEWPRRIILGWSPAEVCTACGEGRRPVKQGPWYFTQPSPGDDMGRRALDRALSLGITATEVAERYGTKALGPSNMSDAFYAAQGGELTERLNSWGYARSLRTLVKRERSGYACACPDVSAPSTPGVVVDPFGGTGTTAIVACALGRRGISIDLNPDYKRLAEWRAADPKQRAKAAGVPAKPVSKAA